MKRTFERRSARGIKDYTALAFTTFGVGYLPIAPGTWGSMVGVGIYFAAGWFAQVTGQANIEGQPLQVLRPYLWALYSVALLLFSLVGIWAAGRCTELFGNDDPSQAVIDEVIGQLITFLFIPFTLSWPLIVAGFLLFRLFDIWKPYPIDDLQNLPAGIGVCADDILAGVYAGVCLSIVYAISLSL